MGKRKSKGYRLPSGEYVTGAVEVTAPKMSSYEKRVKASGKRSNDYRNMGSQIAEGFENIISRGTDSGLENVLEFFPGIGQGLSIDDAYGAIKDLTYNRKRNNQQQNTFNNIFDVLGVTPIGKYGELFNPPNKFTKGIEIADDFMGAYGVAKDIYQDKNIPSINKALNKKAEKSILTNKEKEYADNTYVKPPFITQKANGGTITNDMRKKKNKKLSIDNNLPKYLPGGFVNALPAIGASVNEINKLFGLPTSSMSSGNGNSSSGLSKAAEGLAEAAKGSSTANASGAGGGLGSLGKGAGGGLQSLGSKAAGSLQGNMNKDTLGSLSKSGNLASGIGALSPLISATGKSVAEMVNAFITPEKNYRTTLENTGAHYANGGEINIKPSKRGTFTKAAKQRGMGVQQFASKVLANKDNYSPAMVKKANFARNAAKWKKAMGGIVEPEIFEMGGLTGTYMDAFDAMGYGGNVYDHPDYSNYMALGGMTEGDPTNPPKRLPALDKELYQASAAELIGGPIQNFANYHPEDVARVKLGYYKSGQEYQDAFNKLEDTYAKYNALTDEDRQRVKQENPDVFNPLMKSYNSAKFYQCDGCYGSSDIQPLRYKETVHPVTGRKINVAEFDRPIVKRTTTITDNRANVLPEEDYKLYDRLTGEGFGIDKRTNKFVTDRKEYMDAYKSGNLDKIAYKDKSASEKRASLKNLDLANLPKNAYGGEIDLYMALGGIMGGGDPTLPPPKPTSQDSALVYNMGLGKYYTDRGYKKKNEQKLPINQGSSFKNVLDDVYNNFLSLPQTTYPSASGKAIKGKLDPLQYRKPADPTKPYVVEQRDVASNIVDTRAPFGYYDTRIVPQSVINYQNVNPNDPLYGDVATVPTYDISTKPYAMRTPEEQAEVERKYGKPIPVVEPKRIVPVTDLRRDSKDYLRTLENLDDKNTFIEYLRSGVDANEVRNLAPIEIQRRANAWRSQGMKAYGGMIDPLMAFGGMIDPTMAMQQMMYGSYAQGGQIPQNIPVEVEGEEMYEMPNGETGEFSGPKHENGGIPIALPEGTKIYSDRLKVNGKTMAQRKDKREANINKLEKLLTKNPNDKFIKEALKRQQETAALEEQGDMQMQEQANQEQQMQEMAMEEMLMGAAQQDMQEGMMMAMGGMIKRADGSYSQKGLWDNIRANRGSGKKPTKEMLKQEKKIRAAEKAYGGMIKYADGGKIPQNILRSRLESHMSSQEADSYLNKYQGGTGDSGIPPYNPYGLFTKQFFGQPTTQVSGYNPLMINDEDYLNYLTIQNPNRNLDVTLMPPSEQSYEPTLNYNVETFTEMPSSAYNVATPNTNKTTTPVTQNMYSLKTTTETEDEKDNTYTEGDRTGMAGTAVGMYGPSLMTLLNRMETPPNQNFYNTYGQDALKTQMEAEGIAGQAKDEAYRKNVMRANALRNAIANSARGVGDMRTQQLTAALTEQEGARDILGSYLQSMAGLKGQRANLQAQIDQTRMGGEYQRDLADRQDVDQFYSNLAQNLTGVSEGMQKMGRDKNIAKRNKDILSLSKYYSSYGIYADYDDRGNLVLKDQSTGKVKSEKEIEKLKEEIEKLKKEKE